MNASKTIDRPYPRLLDWLREHHVEYEVHEHDETFTAQATAAAEGVDPRTFAKVVGVAAHDGRRALVVLDAVDHLDLEKARRILGGGDVRLLTEHELAALAPDCPVGAVPPVGSLFGLATYADPAIRDSAEISFNAGSHRFSAHVERAAWERACGVVYASLAVDEAERPVWATS